MLGARRREDGQAHATGELHRRRPDGGRGAPDRQRRARLLHRVRVALGQGSRDAQGDEEGDGGGGHAHGEDGALLKGHAGGELRGADFAEQRIGLPGAVVGVVVKNDCGEADDAVTRGEVRDGWTDGDNDAGDVGAEDGGVGGDEDGVVLNLPVDRVGGDGVVADEELTWTRGGDAARGYGNAAVFGRDDGSEIGS